MIYGSDKRTVAADCRVHSQAQSHARDPWTSTTGSTGCYEWDLMDSSNGCSLERPTRTISPQEHLPSAFPGMDRSGDSCQDTCGISPGLARAWWYRPKHGFYSRTSAHARKGAMGRVEPKGGRAANRAIVNFYLIFLQCWAGIGKVGRINGDALFSLALDGAKTIVSERIGEKACVSKLPVSSLKTNTWRGDRVAEGNGLLNRRTSLSLYRGFESRPLRLCP